MKKQRAEKINGVFINPYLKGEKSPLTQFRVWIWGMGLIGDHYDPIPKGFKYPKPKLDFDPKKPWAMWIGHNTYLISCGGVHILTDPHWGKYCSPIPIQQYKRYVPPPLEIDQLPKIDYVFITHDHYDHLDRKTVKKLFKRFPNILWIVPEGLKEWFAKFGIHNVKELNWWDEMTIDGSFKITSVPAQHFSGRMKLASNKTLWQGLVFQDLRNSKTFYLAGDTGYNPFDFKQIGENFPKIDLSIICIGGYAPRKMMVQVHCCTREQVKIHQEVGAILTLASHWKTFKVSDEPIEQPPYELYREMKRANVDFSTFLVLEIGEKVNW